MDVLPVSPPPRHRHARFREKAAKYIQTRRQYQFFRALVIGVVTGSLALLFQYGLWRSESFAKSFFAFSHAHSRGWFLIFGLGVLAIGTAVAWITSKLAPEAAGSGIPHVKAVLSRQGRLSGKWLLPVKFFGGIFAIGAGFSLGREGPTVQMGAVTGSTVARYLKLSHGERDHLIACGAGAGLAGAFNAPLAGFLFVIEEFGRGLSPMTYGTAFISCLSATLVTQASLGQIPSFHIQQYPMPELASLPLFMVLGVFAGIFGAMFNSSLLFFKQVGQCWTGHETWKKGFMAAALVLLAWFLIPEIVGGGHSSAETLLRGQLPLQHTVWFLIIMLFGKLLLTSICFSSGVPGGIFAPMLMMGATLGSLAGHIGSTYFPHLVPTPAAFAVVGMAAIFVSSVRAPLTGMVLILEMTGNYAQLFPLAVTCLISYLISTWLGNPAIYEALVEADRRYSTHPIGNGTSSTLTSL